MPVWKNSGAFRGLYCWTCGEMQNSGEGHIPGSMNIPIDRIGTVKEKIKDRETHIFTYCLGGHRSGQAARALKAMGYQNTVCIGGVTRYKGELER